MLNYYEIGQRVRRFRKAQGLSQEELAERVAISVTHMSHIETGNTKLSLPVLVDLAQALRVSTDDLLCDTPADRKNAITAELSELLERCTPAQAKVLLDVAQTTKAAMDKFL